MPLLDGARRAPWLAGAGRLLIAALAALPVLYFLGWGRWPLFVGAFVLALLALGALERRWQARPLPHRSRPAGRHRFRVLTGGKDKGKGNGHAHDVPDEGDDPEGSPGKPRWLM